MLHLCAFGFGHPQSRAPTALSPLPHSVSRQRESGVCAATRRGNCLHISSSPSTRFDSTSPSCSFSDRDISFLRPHSLVRESRQKHNTCTEGQENHKDTQFVSILYKIFDMRPCSSIPARVQPAAVQPWLLWPPLMNTSTQNIPFNKWHTGTKCWPRSCVDMLLTEKSLFSSGRVEAGIVLLKQPRGDVLLQERHE